MRLRKATGPPRGQVPRVPCEMLSVSVVGNPSGSGIPSLSPQPGARSLPDLRGETFVLSDVPTATAGSCLPHRRACWPYSVSSPYWWVPAPLPPGGEGGCQAQRLMEKLDESMKNFAA